MEKASSVSSRLTQSKVDFDDFSYTIDIYGVQYEHITRNSSLPISFSIGYAEEDYSSDIGGISFLDSKEKMLGIGAYVRDNTKIAFDYVRNEFSNVRLKVYDLNIKSVMKTGAGSSFTIYASVDQRDLTGDGKIEIYTFNPTYYVNQRIGIGTIFRADSDGEGREYVLNAEIFFTSQFAVKLEIRKFTDRNDPNYEADGLQVSFTGRF